MRLEMTDVATDCFRLSSKIVAKSLLFFFTHQSTSGAGKKNIAS